MGSLSKFSRNQAKQTAIERIGILMSEASKNIHNPLAQRYVELARKISMKYKVSIPKEWKHFICHGCKKLILPGVNCKVRIQPKRKPHIVITCLLCGHIKRLTLK